MEEDDERVKKGMMEEANGSVGRAAYWSGLGFE